jgi:putative transposase
LTRRHRPDCRFIPVSYTANFSCSSWPHQAERFFALITDKAIRRGSFTGLKRLVQRIDHFVTACNTNCRPFRWTGTADSILEKLRQPCSRIDGTGL